MQYAAGIHRYVGRVCSLRNEKEGEKTKRRRRRRPRQATDCPGHTNTPGTPLHCVSHALPTYKKEPHSVSLALNRFACTVRRRRLARSRGLSGLLEHGFFYFFFYETEIYCSALKAGKTQQGTKTSIATSTVQWKFDSQYVSPSFDSSVRLPLLCSLTFHFHFFFISAGKRKEIDCC